MEELAMHILDIVYNSIRAKATLIKIFIEVSIKNNIIKIIIEDNGCGMDIETLNKVADPFYTTRKTRKVGLGISLLKQTALMADGDFKIESKVNEGTKVSVSFKKDNIDTPMMGDLSETFVCILNADEMIDYEFKYIDDNHEFELKTSDLKNILDGVPISEPSVLLFIKDYIKKGINNEID